MNIFESIVLGLTQGVTEFIPVSSSGHLEIIQRILNSGARAEDFHFFLELINFGTLLALLIFFRKKIWQIIQDIFKRKDWRLAVNILITSIPAGVIGLLLSHLIENNGFFSSMYTVAIAMGAVGILMIVIEKLPHLSEVRTLEKLPKTRALGIGLVQVFALIPGVSRSGSTIVMGRIMGFNSENAAEYSFLASIPIMCGVCLKSVVSSSSRAYIAANLGTLAIANLIAFASGMIAIYFVMNFLKKRNSLQAFGYYRVIVATIVLIFTLIQ